MAEPITMETVLAGRLREAGHLNYGKRGGGTIWQHTTIRRLKAIDRPALTDGERLTVGGRGLREWCVDGGKAGSLPTPEEIALIAAGAPIYLVVLGIAHPPVSLSVGNPPAEDAAQPGVARG